MGPVLLDQLAVGHGRQPRLREPHLKQEDSGSVLNNLESLRSVLTSRSLFLSSSHEKATGKKWVVVSVTAAWCLAAAASPLDETMAALVVVLWAS